MYTDRPSLKVKKGAGVKFTYAGAFIFLWLALLTLGGCAGEAALNNSVLTPFDGIWICDLELSMNTEVNKPLRHNRQLWAAANGMKMSIDMEKQLITESYHDNSSVLYQFELRSESMYRVEMKAWNRNDDNDLHGWRFIYANDMLFRRTLISNDNEPFLAFRRYGNSGNSQILANWQAMNYSEEENYITTKERTFPGELVEEGKLTYTREGEYGETFRIVRGSRSKDKTPMPNIPYIIFFSDNTKVEGVTDEKGLIPYQSRNYPAFFRVKIFPYGKP
ncbi:MAG: hypothetical protein LBJ14_03870 [Desulfarculales bacterium]|jgi:hypothetical protein|nr:hypothetical protein [Desulfarculales bacterium]